MKNREFFDTNILVYALDRSDPQRQQIAANLLRKALHENTFVISTQVLQEFYVTVTRKIKIPLDEVAAERIVEILSMLEIVEINIPIIRESIRLSRDRKLSLWDSLILTAACRAGCRCVYSEDLSHGLKVGSLRVIDPFRH